MGANDAGGTREIPRRHARPLRPLRAARARTENVIGGRAPFVAQGALAEGASAPWATKGALPPITFSVRARAARRGRSGLACRRGLSPVHPAPFAPTAPSCGRPNA